MISQKFPQKCDIAHLAVFIPQRKHFIQCQWHLHSISCRSTKLHRPRNILRNKLSKKMKADLKHLVFAYGTLKRGEPNFKWLTEEAEGTFKVLAVGKTTKKKALVIGSRYNVPYLLDHSGKIIIFRVKLLNKLYLKMKCFIYQISA